MTARMTIRRSTLAVMVTPEDVRMRIAMAGDAASGCNPDCDDTDPLIIDTEEVWYDGIDADCDGADDYDREVRCASVAAWVESRRRGRLRRWRRRPPLPWTTAAAATKTVTGWWTNCSPPADTGTPADWIVGGGGAVPIRLGNPTTRPVTTRTWTLAVLEPWTRRRRAVRRTNLQIRAKGRLLPRSVWTSEGPGEERVRLQTPVIIVVGTPSAGRAAAASGGVRWGLLMNRIFLATVSFGAMATNRTTKSVRRLQLHHLTGSQRPRRHFRGKTQIFTVLISHTGGGRSDVITADVINIEGLL